MMQGRVPVRWLAVVLGFSCTALGKPATPPVLHVSTGERLDASLLGPGVVEDMDAVIRRERESPPADMTARKIRDIRGRWIVQTRYKWNSGESLPQYVVNGGGATRMGIDFPEPVDVRGAFFMGQGGRGSWTPGLRAVGYRGGVEVAVTPWFCDLTEQFKWFDMSLREIDRLVIECLPAIGDAAGWYAMDDLTFVEPARHGQPAKVVALTFQDVQLKTDLTGLKYAGLTWERGEGGIDREDAVPPPQSAFPRKPAPAAPEPAAPGDDQPAPRAATAPQLLSSFQGVVRGDAGQSSYPPDTCGAIGPNHFVEAVNRVFAIYNKTSGALVSATSLVSFMGGSGDPRVAFDQHSGRWVVINSDFSSRIYLAVSTTNDPTGSWFKTNFVASSGTDAGAFPDYPTLGLDANGIYISCYMVGVGMSIFTVDKAPMIAPVPSLGTVTAFRNLPYERAIQPAHTYGNPGSEYIVSTGGAGIRLRRVDPPLTAPTLVLVGEIGTSGYSDPPDVPALGSTTPLDSVDARLMNAVYRNGSVWTAHTIAGGAGAAIRWYQLNVSPPAVVQFGTISDSLFHYWFPSISVTPLNDALIGFSGCHAGIYAACYYAGRANVDPPGTTSPPALLRAGSAPHNLIDGYGRNRWGDYSLTTLDPTDTSRLWTIQEYAHANNVWGTYIGKFRVFADCNSNGVGDAEDIANQTSLDCDSNGVPDECQVPPLCPTCADCQNDGIPDICQVPPRCPTCPDCNANSVPDSCEPDCNSNGSPDGCDVLLGTSLDCQPDGVPDECQRPPLCALCPDCDHNGVPDSCDLFAGDCNADFVPDRCQTDPTLCGGSCLADCDGNFVPDACQMIGAFLEESPDLAPFFNASPQSYTLIAPPPASGDVTLAFVAAGDLGSTIETVAVDINGTPVGTLFAAAFDCTEVHESLVVSAATFNGIVGGGDAAIHMVPSAAVDPGVCPVSRISVRVSYATSVGDCNENGALDVCEIAAGAEEDCNANSVPDACEIAAGLLSDFDFNGRADECECIFTCPGDFTFDGAVRGDDVQYFLNCLVSGMLLECGCADLNADFTLDSADITLMVDRLVLDPDPNCH